MKTYHEIKSKAFAEIAERNVEQKKIVEEALTEEVANTEIATEADLNI